MAEVSPYSRYASVYDLTGQSAFSLRAWVRARELLDGLGWKGRDILELACGTGVLAERLAAEGYRVVAADRARAMLLEARRRRRADCPGANCLVCADMTALPFADGSFDLVTSFFDSMNYLLTAEDLGRTLAEIARVLRPGGCLVFDLNTPFTLKEHWHGLCSAFVHEQVASVWQAEWYEERQVSSLRATFFVRGEDGRWDRFDEVHDERGFSDKELDRAFRHAGLTAERIEDLATRRAPAGTTRRVMYCLRKRAGKGKKKRGG